MLNIQEFMLTYLGAYTTCRVLEELSLLKIFAENDVLALHSQKNVSLCINQKFSDVINKGPAWCFILEGLSKSKSAQPQLVFTFFLRPSKFWTSPTFYRFSFLPSICPVC